MILPHIEAIHDKSGYLSAESMRITELDSDVFHYSARHGINVLQASLCPNRNRLLKEHAFYKHSPFLR